MQFTLQTMKRVGYTANTIHVDSTGTVWAFLANGKVAASNSNDETQFYFGAKRFGDCCFSGDCAYVNEQIRARQSGVIKELSAHLEALTSLVDPSLQSNAAFEESTDPETRDEFTFRKMDQNVKPFHLKVSVLNRSEQSSYHLSLPFQMD